MPKDESALMEQVQALLHQQQQQTVAAQQIQVGGLVALKWLIDWLIDIKTYNVYNDQCTYRELVPGRNLIPALSLSLIYGICFLTVVRFNVFVDCRAGSRPYKPYSCSRSWPSSKVRFSRDWKVIKLASFSFSQWLPIFLFSLMCQSVRGLHASCLQ